MFNYNNQNGNYNGNTPNGRNGNVGGADNFETLQNARRDLVGEIDAIIQYDDHLHKTDIEIAKSTWKNIRDEELTHVGELLGLLFYLAPYQKEFVEKGLKEFTDRLKRKP